jgi:membrane protein required for colicin V production
VIIDFIFAALMVLAFLKGWQRGLIVALFSIIAFIIGLAAALKLSTAVAGWLGSSTNVSAKWLPFISFALVFFVVVLLVRLGGKLIEKTFQAVMLGWANRIAGILLYAALYTIIFSIFLFYAEKIQLLKPATVTSSLTYTFIEPWGPKVIDGFGAVIPLFKDMFAELEIFFDKLAK